MNLVLADDHAILRKALKSMLERDPDLHIAGEANDANEAIELVERLKPHVLVLDITMGDTNGLDVLRRLRRTSPGTRIVVLSMHDNVAYIAEAFSLGACAYVLKQDDAEELLEAVRHAAEGKRCFSARFSEEALESYRKKTQECRGLPADSLTRREREVVRLTVEGLSSSEIGRRLAIKQRTIETHQANIMRKLGVHSKTDLIRYSLQRALVPVDEWVSGGKS